LLFYLGLIMYVAANYYRHPIILTLLFYLGLIPLNTVPICSFNPDQAHPHRYLRRRLRPNRLRPNLLP